MFLKIFEDDRGAENDRCMRSLWEATRGAEHLAIPEPLGYDRSLCTVITEEISGGRGFAAWIRALEDGEPLPADVDRERLRRCLAVVARSLAELHACGLELGDGRTYADDLQSRLADFGALQELEPRVAALAGSLIRRLTAAVPDREPLVCAHGGFRHKQLLGDEQRVATVDWDGMTMAHPALDAATFICHLRQVPICTPGQALLLEELAHDFRREVLACEPDVTPHDLALFEAMELTRKVYRSYRRGAKGEARFAEVQRMITAAEQLLDGVEQPAAQVRGDS